MQRTSYFLETDVSGKWGELPGPSSVGLALNVLQTGEYLDPKNSHSCVVLRCPPVFILPYKSGVREGLGTDFFRPARLAVRQQHQALSPWRPSRGGVPLGGARRRAGTAQ